MKIIKLLLVILLLAVAVMAVLSVTYPEMQQGIKEFLEGLYQRFSEAFGAIFKPVGDAFNGG